MAEAPWAEATQAMVLQAAFASMLVIVEEVALVEEEAEAAVIVAVVVAMLMAVAAAWVARAVALAQVVAVAPLGATAARRHAHFLCPLLPPLPFRCHHPHLFRHHHLLRPLPRRCL